MYRAYPEPLNQMQKMHSNKTQNVVRQAHVRVNSQSVPKMQMSLDIASVWRMRKSTHSQAICSKIADEPQNSVCQAHTQPDADEP